MSDSGSVTCGEVLTLKLVAKADIHAAPARIVVLSDAPAAAIRRFDLDSTDPRIPSQSAASLLQTSREGDRSTRRPPALSVPTACPNPGSA